ncbi:MAG: hypothetical protein OER43_06935 [Gammaproteobacteria bacterium]|nr:hypothetical protein [Gammaproteobacteria bacterium]MDH3412619.1 hypothetical protein [Gammaproteobacteria bacterium]
MDLVYSAALLGLATVFSVVVLLGARRPVEPAWAAEWLVANVWCVAITALIGFGVSFAVCFALSLKSQPIGLMEIALIAGVASAYYLILRLMAPRRRLAEYASRLAESTGGDREPSTAEIIQLALPVGDGRSPDKPTLPKAA